MSGARPSRQSRLLPVSARARLRPKSQLTLPEEVRRALRVNEGDEIEFKIGENGSITIRGYISVPAEHAWLYEPQRISRQDPDRDPADRQAATVHESTDALFVRLDALGAADS